MYWHNGDRQRGKENATTQRNGLIMAGRNTGFGRDEMDALLGGGGLSEAVLRSGVGSDKKSIKKKGEKNVADMSVRETAAMLKSQQTEKAKKVGQTVKGAKQQARLRVTSKKSRNYHQMVEEESLLVSHEDAVDDSDSDSDNNFINNTLKVEKRTKAAPVIVKKQPTTKQTRYDSSDDDSEPDSDTSSSSSSDSEADRRRERRLQQRKKDLAIDPRPEEISNFSEPAENDTAGVLKAETERSSLEQNVKPAKAGEKSSSSSSESGTEEESSSEEEESSSEEDQSSVIKPVFVPKHKRGTLKSVAAMEAEEEEALEAQDLRKKRRQKESRILLQQVVAESKKTVHDTETAFDGVLGAQNDVPDDSDESYEKDAWEVRELVRIITELDLESAQAAERKELERRRALTDEERLAEDVASGRYRKPGENREKISGRYQHKGAFYMDSSEWDETDVRHKAAEYATASTNEGRTRDDLPEVMKVKKFGFANQSKYRGLKAEDTSDRTQKILPLVSGKKRKA